LEGKLEGKYTSKLDELRRKRHDAFYTQFKEVSEGEAKEATGFAREFLKKIEVLLRQ
jgi:uncharacterized protein (UPF0332 family)